MESIIKQLSMNLNSIQTIDSVNSLENSSIILTIARNTRELLRQLIELEISSNIIDACQKTLIELDKAEMVYKRYHDTINSNTLVGDYMSFVGLYHLVYNNLEAIITFLGKHGKIRN